MEPCDYSVEQYAGRFPGKVLPESILRDVCHDVSHAITILHQANVAHRDIKPANILVKNSPIQGRRRPTYKRKNNNNNNNHTLFFMTPNQIF